MDNDALVVIDVLNDFEHDDGDRLLASLRTRQPGCLTIDEERESIALRYAQEVGGIHVDETAPDQA